MIHTFRATHCGQTFTGADGAKALEAHMKGAHKRRTIAPGSDNRQLIYSGRGRSAPGWKGGQIEPPTPWKAPKAPADSVKLSKVLADHAGKFGEVLEWETDALVSASELAPGDVFNLQGGTERYRVIDAHPSPIDGNPLEIQLEVVGSESKGAHWLQMVGRRKLESAPVVLVERAS